MSRLPSRVKLFAAISISVVLLVLFLAPMNAPLYNLLLFPYSDPRTPSIDGALQEFRGQNFVPREIVFPSKNGRLLHGILFERADTPRIFLYNHTKGNNMYLQISKAHLFFCCGASVFMYDYQGFGRSEGRTTAGGTCEDALAAYDYLIQHEHRKGKDIIAIGESYGSGVTGQLATHRELAGVIMLSGFSSLISCAKDKLFWLRWYPLWSFPREFNMDNVSVFERVHPPLLIVHGKTDVIVPCGEARTLYARAAEPKSMLLFPKGHCTFGKGNEFAIAVRQFLKENNI